MPPISATLIAYNEALDLPQALASLQGVADEVIVVDSGSSDDTCGIAARAGARVVTQAFTDFAEQKNFAASQATHQWILSLDADEALSPELRASLLAWKRTEPSYVAYEFTRKTNFLGGWIHHSGWYPEYRVRLYRRDRAAFVGVLHETVRADGPAGRLGGDLFHYTVRTLKEHDAKLEVFTDKAAEDLFARGRRHWRAGMYLSAPWTVLQKFLLQRGFLDGRRGALIAWTAGRYVWTKYRKLGVLVRGGTLQRHDWPQAGDD